MKKYISVFLIVCMLILSVGTMAKNGEVEGLSKAMSNLLMRNHFSPEQIQAIYDARIAAKTNYFWDTYLPAARQLGRISTQTSDEEAYLSYIEDYKDVLGYDNGILCTMLSTGKYIRQYSENGTFSYLLSDEQYWSIGAYPTICAMDGTFIDESVSGNYVRLAEGGKEFLENPQEIENELLSMGVNEVEEISLFALYPSLSFMYIKTGDAEYMVKLYGSTGSRELLPNIKLFKVYPVNVVMDAIIEPQGSLYNIMQAAESVKPTYEAEATALNQEGLLKGNENGLDLLKPLTRIEAATMLLRAMGEDETTDAGQTQTFSDVPSEHWGFGAAENAYNLGLVKGVGDDKFAPDESVTAVQFATMVLRAGAEPEFNWEEAINIMIDKGILTQENASTMDFFTRGDMAKIIYEARANGLL